MGPNVYIDYTSSEINAMYFKKLICVMLVFIEQLFHRFGKQLDIFINKVRQLQKYVMFRQQSKHGSYLSKQADDRGGLHKSRSIQALVFLLRLSGSQMDL